MSAVAPSPFAKLLRRSKFASYDPSIGQVYTTYGGHAHRGNWGVKRPLPNRRKTGFITLRSIDSPEQQTEWNSAESSARWIRRWDEMGKKLHAPEHGLWYHRTNGKWYPDSEFSSESLKEQYTSAAVGRQLYKTLPFSSKRFERYLDEIRSLRPEFKRFLKEELERQESRSPNSHRLPIKAFASGEVDLYATIQRGADVYATQFQKRETRLGFESDNPSIPIGSEPHIFAGLEPTILSPLQIRYLYGPSSGRVVARNVPPSKKHSVTFNSSDRIDIATVGGIVAQIHSKGRATDLGTATSLRRDADAGVDSLRITRIDLVEPPNVVQRNPETAKETTFESIKIFSSHDESNVSNPYPLGSRDYVGKEPSSPAEAIQIPKTMSRHAAEGRSRVTRKSKMPGEATNGILTTLTRQIAKPIGTDSSQT